MESSELLREVIIIKWGVVCIAVSLWGVTVYMLLKEIPRWWKSFDANKKQTIGFHGKQK